MKAFAARGLTRFVGREAGLELLLSRPRSDRGSARVRLSASWARPASARRGFSTSSCTSASTEGWLVLATSAVSYGKSTPYLPITEMLRTYFDVDDRDEAARVRERVAAEFVALDPELRPLLPAFWVLLGVPVSDPDPGWAQLDPPHRRGRIHEALKRFMIGESRLRPVCLILENLHWIDLETQAFIESLAEVVPHHRLLLLFNYRREYRHPWLSAAHVTDLKITPLTPPLAAELLQTLVGPDATLRPLKQIMLDRAEGNPFFLEEMVRSLVETEALVGTPGAYHLVRPVRAVQVLRP